MMTKQIISSEGTQVTCAFFQWKIYTWKLLKGRKRCKCWGKLRNLLGCGEDHLSKPRMPPSGSTPWCVVHGEDWSRKPPQKVQDFPYISFALALQPVQNDTIEMSGKGRQCTKHHGQKMWRGLFSLFIHGLLTSVAFCFSLEFWGLGFVVLVSGFVPVFFLMGDTPLC